MLTTRRVLLGGVLAAGAALIAATSLVASARLTECEEAAAWAEANLDVLPKSYAEFSTYSLVYRKAIYKRLSLEEKTRLWDDHLAAFAELNVLTPEQHDMVTRLRSEVAHHLAVGPSDALAALEADARAVLGTPLARRAIAILGPQQISPTTGVPSEACSCSQGSDWCNSAYDCGDDNDGCDDIDDECGTWWAHDCDGECLQPE